MIATHIAQAITVGIPGVTLAGVHVRDPAKTKGFPALSLRELVDRSDLVVEAATQAALRELAPAVLSAGRHLRSPIFLAVSRPAAQVSIARAGSSML